jgi:hypothetical protein
MRRPPVFADPEAIQNERGALSLARREGEVAAQARAVLTVL